MSTDRRQFFVGFLGASSLLAFGCKTANDASGVAASDTNPPKISGTRGLDAVSGTSIPPGRS